MVSRDEEQLLQRLSGAVIATDQAGHILFMSENAQRLLGADRTGEPLVDIVPPRLRPRHLEGFRRYMETGESRLEGKRVEVAALRDDGTEVDVALRVRLYKRPDGSDLIIGLLAPRTSPDAPDAEIVRFESDLQRRAYRLI